MGQPRATDRATLHPLGGWVSLSFQPSGLLSHNIPTGSQLLSPEIVYIILSSSPPCPPFHPALSF